MNYADFILYENTYDADQAVSIYKGETYTLNDYREEVDGSSVFFRIIIFRKTARPCWSWMTVLPVSHCIWPVSDTGLYPS